MTNCIVCDRELTDPESIRRQIGPDCLKWIRNLKAKFESGAIRQGRYGWLTYKTVMKTLAENGVNPSEL